MTKTANISVLIIDDHSLVRMGLRHLLDNAPGIKVVGEAEDGQAALELARKLSPDIILMDIKMPNMDGIEATRRLLRFKPKPNILIISVHEDHLLPTRLLDVGVLGYITKDATNEELIHAVRTVSAGVRYICPKMAQKVALNRYQVDHSPFEQLSTRELQVAKMITTKSSTQEMADTLHISQKTINTYRYRLYKKLQVKNDIELLYLAIQHGLIERPLEPLA